MTGAYIGQPVDRVDGRAKVTGSAKYAGEYSVPNLAYGFVVSSEIPKGRIRRIDTEQASSLEGVLQIFTHGNAPRTARLDRAYRDDVAPPGAPFRPFKDDRIRFSGQPVALVVADTLELARYAASLIRIDYQCEPHGTDLRANRDHAYDPKPRPQIPPLPKPRGDADQALAGSAVQHDAEYYLEVEHHNPMEPYATTVVWEGDGRLTIYDKTQGAQNNQQYVSRVFGMAEDDVHLVSKYVGGGFGSGLRPQYQLYLAVMAARELKRPVRVTLTRQQLFAMSYRPAALQRVALGATTEGRLQAVIHEAMSQTSHFEDYTDPIVSWSGELYACENVRLGHTVVQLDLNTPADMRAPGAAPGLLALETAMDELAYKLKIDPLELRLRNYAAKDGNSGRPFSSKALRECYRQASERFGWSRRTPEPRSMREDGTLIGWGMATGSWFAEQVPASAKAVLSADGRLMIRSATADIGTGTYTVMTQIAAETLGLPIEDVTFDLGDSSFPKAPVEGGSFTVSSVGPAVKAACDKIREKLAALVRKSTDTRIAGAKPEDLMFAGGQIRLRDSSAPGVTIHQVMRQAGIGSIEAEANAAPNAANHSKYTMRSHSAVFAEVGIDEDLGAIEVRRLVSAVAAGRMVNPKTARSQIIGGLVWGIGMALEEESLMDHRFGRFMNHNLAEYHVPVQADARDLDVIFVEEEDTIVNPLGVKGVGELGLNGVAAAIGNAVFHATGKRVREFPITLDKVM